MARHRRRGRSASSSSYYSYNGYPPYVPVAQRRAQAAVEVLNLKKSGKDVQPLQIEGKTIARSFWGKSWCAHLESFSDFANRLPRGRTYARNGSVCHLEIKAGVIEALVSGSRLYKITIKIKALKPDVWKSVKQKCSGGIGTMLELLQGKLSDSVMAAVCDQKSGLFPHPTEIDLGCSCPDWASMCKHVAAVLYGVGNRLDQQPELLFLLRGVDPKELITAKVALADATPGADALAADGLEALFGIEMDNSPSKASSKKLPTPAATKKAVKKVSESKSTTDKPPSKTPSKKPAKPSASKSAVKVVAESRSTSGKKPAQKKLTDKAAKVSPPEANSKSEPAANQPLPFDPNHPRGASITALREVSGLTTTRFASRINVDPGLLRRWESIPGPVKLPTQQVSALRNLQNKLVKEGIIKGGGKGAKK